MELREDLGEAKDAGLFRHMYILLTQVGVRVIHSFSEVNLPAKGDYSRVHILVRTELCLCALWSCLTLPGAQELVNRSRSEVTCEEAY